MAIFSGVIVSTLKRRIEMDERASNPDAGPAAVVAIEVLAACPAASAREATGKKTGIDEGPIIPAEAFADGCLRDGGN